MFRGGYVLLSREILTSDFYSFTPCTREVFMYLLLKVNYIDGKRFKRGSQFFQLARVREDLAWSKGFVKQTYTEDQMKTALNTLVKHDMITCTKTARGVHVTICNYDTYQNPDNYDYRNEARRKPAMNPGTKPSMKAPLKQKKEKVIKNKNKQTKKESEKVYNNVTTISWNEDGKVVEERAEDKLNIGKDITEVMNASKRFLPAQTDMHRVYVTKHIRDHGKEVILEAVNLYWDLFSKGKIEKPVNSPVYYWNEGVYGWINRVLQERIKIEETKTTTRYCYCGSKEYETDKVPSYCPECDSILYSKVEWASVQQSENPQPEVVEDSGSTEKSDKDEFFDALEKLGESMRMK